MGDGMVKSMGRQRACYFTRKAMLAASVLMLAVALGGKSAGMEAGVARVDITPPPGLPMYGYFTRIRNHQLSTGTLDPLYARVLVLAVGEKRVGLVALDLGRTFGKGLLEELEQRARIQNGISFLVVTASHTHAGPNILDEYAPGETPAWETSALRVIESAIGEACRQLKPVRLGVGYGSVEIGYNRRVANPDGTVTMLWTNPTKRPTAPLDPTVGVLRIDTADGSPLAILINYACHPVIFGEDNLSYSADFPGVTTELVRQAFGGKPLCMFLQGADGDIDPYYASTPLADGAIKWRDWTGEQLALEAITVSRGIQTRTDPEASLLFKEDIVRVRPRWDPKKFRDGLLAVFGPKVFEDHADLFAQKPLSELELPVTVFLIDKQIAFVGMPGEPFVDFQVAWRARCPVPNAFFLGYANGYFDYFPTLRAAAEGGYGAGDSNTYVAVGACERMLDKALEKVYEMLGKMPDLPEDLRGVK